MRVARLVLAPIAAAAMVRLGLACATFAGEPAPPVEAGMPPSTDGSVVGLDGATSVAEAGAPDARFCKTIDADACEDFEAPQTVWAGPIIDAVQDAGRAEITTAFGKDSSSSFRGRIFDGRPIGCASAELSHPITQLPTKSVRFGFDLWLEGVPPGIANNYVARLEVTSRTSRKCHVLVSATESSCGLSIQDTTAALQSETYNSRPMPSLLRRWTRVEVAANLETHDVEILLNGNVCVTHVAQYCLVEPAKSLELRVGPFCSNPPDTAPVETFHDNVWFSTE